MLTAKGFSDLPTVTPTMVEDLTDAHLQGWHADICKDLSKVARLSELLGIDRADEIDRLMESAARLHDEITTRRDTVRMLAQANAILQGVS